jgi:hypothetical protein
MPTTRLFQLMAFPAHRAAATLTQFSHISLLAKHFPENFLLRRLPQLWLEIMLRIQWNFRARSIPIGTQ